MARFRSRMAMRPINRIKHVQDFSGAVASGSQLALTLVSATDTPTLANTSGVETGSTVHGIFLNIQVATNEPFLDGAIPNVYLMVWKNPGGNLTAPTASGSGPSDNKKYIIHQEMLMLQNTDGSNPRSLFKGVIAIPKGYKRFGPNDTLLAEVLSPQVDIVLCDQCIYKEFR